MHRAYYLYINGRLAGYHEDSKTPAEFDITKLVTEGKNHMAIVAYADPVSTTLENPDPDEGNGSSGRRLCFRPTESTDARLRDRHALRTRRHERTVQLRRDRQIPPAHPNR